MEGEFIHEVEHRQANEKKMTKTQQNRPGIAAARFFWGWVLFLLNS